MKLLKLLGRIGRIDDRNADRVMRAVDHAMDLRQDVPPWVFPALDEVLRARCAVERARRPVRGGSSLFGYADPIDD